MGNSCCSSAGVLQEHQHKGQKGTYLINEDLVTGPVIESECFKHMEDLQRDYYMTESQAKQLLFQRGKYKEVCEVEEYGQKQKAVEELAEGNLKLQGEVHHSHIRALKMLEVLFCKDFNLNNLRCDGMSDTEISEVAKKCKEACHQDLSAFYFLSTYLMLCAENLSKSGKKVIEVEERMTEIIKKIRKEHPPNENKPSVFESKKYKEADELAKEYCKKNQGSNTIFDLPAVKEDERNQKLVSEILKIAQKSGDNLENLIEITKDSCLWNEGWQYKVGVKVSIPHRQSALDRVEEKLLSKEFQKLEIGKDKKDLADFLQQEKKAYHQQLEGIFRKTDKPIEFTVSDMLRGKCMFNEIRPIIEAAKSIAENCQKKSYPIVEIDNRLEGKTKDLVFKILIDGIVTEFQLAYVFNLVDNEFNHKIYELLRSKFLTVISTLNELSINGHIKLTELYQLVTASAKMKEDIRENRNIYTKLTERSTLQQQMQKWLQKCNVQITQSNSERQMMTFNPNNKTDNKKTDKYLCAIYMEKLCKYSESQKYLKNWYTSKSNLDEDQKKIKYHKKLASIKNQMGQTDEALNFYQKLLQIQKKVRGEDSLDCAATLNRIGIAYGDKGHYKQALDNYQQSYEIKKKAKGAESIQCAQILNNIGLIYKGMSDYKLALQKFQQSYDIKKKLQGADSMQCATTLQNMGTVHQVYKDKNKALQNYQQSYEIKKKVRGEDSMDCAITLQNIGSFYQTVKTDYKTALEYYEKSYQIKKRLKGPDSIDCARTLENIAIVYHGRLEYRTALKYYNQSLEIKRRVKGVDSIDCARTLNSMGILNQLKWSHKEACQCFEEAYRIVKLLPNPESHALYAQLPDKIKVCKEKMSAK